MHISSAVNFGFTSLCSHMNLFWPYKAKFWIRLRLKNLFMYRKITLFLMILVNFDFKKTSVVGKVIEEKVISVPNKSRGRFSHLTR